MSRFRFVAVEICDLESGEVRETVPVTEGINYVTSSFGVAGDIYRALASRQPVVGVTVRFSGFLEPDVPDWVFCPDEDIERTLIAGYAWPPLRRLLEGRLGIGIDLMKLGSRIADGLAARYRVEIESRETKFRHVSGFDVQVLRDGQISIRDQGTDRPINIHFHAFNDKHRLFVSLNEAVRAVAPVPLDVPIVLPGYRSWMASEWTGVDGHDLARAIGQMVIVNTATDPG